MSTINATTLRATTIQHTNGTTSATINSSGYFLNSNIATWQARLNTNQAQGNTLIWQLEDWDTASGYDTSNGRFTAPVGGYYFVHFHLLPNNPSALDTRFEIHKNGVCIAGQRYIITKNANTWNTVQGTAIVQLNTNDYVTIFFQQGDNTHLDSNYVSFKGFLIG